MAKKPFDIDFHCEYHEGPVKLERVYSVVPRGWEPVDHIKLGLWACSGMDNCGYKHEGCPKRGEFVQLIKRNA